MNGKRVKALRREAKNLLGREHLNKARWTTKRIALTAKGALEVKEQATKDEFRTYKRAWKQTKDVGKPGQPAAAKRYRSDEEG